MSHFKCSVSGCQRYAVLRLPYCPYCTKYHCFDHIEDAVFHPCCRSPKPKRLPHLDDHDCYGPIVDKLDLPTIVAQAEALRPGHKCKGPDRLIIGDRGYTSFITSGSNIHFPIEFDDGQKWMVRARQISYLSPPYEADKADVLSEAATFKRLHEAGAKVPQVWLPSEWANEALYYFVDFVEGDYHPLMMSLLPEEPDDTLKAIIRNLAEFHISLETVVYDSVGSLTFDQDGSIVVGPVINLDMINTEPPFHLGPFKSAKERYISLINHLLDLIAQDAYCAPSQSLPMYLALLEARSLVRDCKDMDEGAAYICHGEPKGDHVLVNEKGDITAVIDWEGSYLSCKAEAFAAPWALISASAFKGDNELSSREEYLRDTYLQLGRPDLAHYVEGTRRWLRLGNILAGTTKFPELMATRQAFEQASGEGKGSAPETEEHWRQGIIARHANDEALQRLVAKYS